jgi:dethiobiotin synthetase
MSQLAPSTSLTPTTQPAPLHGCFVTGTDTEVGKTRISAALLHWGARQGWSSAGFKPVAAGTSLIDGHRVNDDVRVLRQASSLVLTGAEVGPCQLETACAPHIAAALQHQAINRAALLRAAQALASRADLLVVEGVGGFCVPLGPDWDTSDLACDFQLPVVLVVGLRLGCINHALLTAQAVRARGLRLLGWIGNVVDANMPWVDENITCLRERLWQQHQAPCLGLVPWLAEPTPAKVAAHLDNAVLTSVFAPVLTSPFSSLASP